MKKNKVKLNEKPTVKEPTDTFRPFRDFTHPLLLLIEIPPVKESNTTFIFVGGGADFCSDMGVLYEGCLGAMDCALKLAGSLFPSALFVTLLILFSLSQHDLFCIYLGKFNCHETPNRSLTQPNFLLKP